MAMIQAGDRHRPRSGFRAQVNRYNGEVAGSERTPLSGRGANPTVLLPSPSLLAHCRAELREAIASAERSFVFGAVGVFNDGQAGEQQWFCLIEPALAEQNLAQDAPGQWGSRYCAACGLRLVH